MMGAIGQHGKFEELVVVSMCESGEGQKSSVLGSVVTISFW